MLSSGDAKRVLAEISPLLAREGLERGEVLLRAQTESGYSVEQIYRDSGAEPTLRFLMVDATLDTQQVSRLKAELIHQSLIGLSERIICSCSSGKMEDLVPLLSEALRADQGKVRRQLRCAVHFIERVGSLEEWLEGKGPMEAYRGLVLGDAFGSYDKCARLYLKFIGHPSLGLGIVDSWSERLGEFPIVVDGAIGRFFLTTGLICPFLRAFLGSEPAAREYLEEVATYQGYDAKYVCSIALEDPINYALTREFQLEDTLALENGMWRFSRKGGTCPDNPKSRKCQGCPVGGSLAGFGAACDMGYRAYGGPLFSQVCQNYIEYQKDVVHVCADRTEECFEQTFEELFFRPLSPTLLRARFNRGRKVRKYVHLLPKRPLKQ